MFTQSITCVFQVFQEEMGVVKSYNLKPGGDKIPVTKQNRKGESTLGVPAVSTLFYFISGHYSVSIVLVIRL